LDIVQETKQIYKLYGQSKSMETKDEPCYFLQRNFKGDQDLLIIFKTLPCRAHCKFCNLSDREWTDGMSITDQFAYVVNQLKHSLSVLNRVTLSNNGSILDFETVSLPKIMEVVQAITQIRNISTIVLETDLKYIEKSLLRDLQQISGKVRLNILAGFETLNENIMLETLGKHRTKAEFERQLDVLAEAGCDFTSYILFKPSQFMTDNEAYEEAKRSAYYLIEECEKRKLKLTLRINPMFAAHGSEWKVLAEQTSSYSPPRISDVFSLALELDKCVPTYLGLSTENKSEEWGSYRVHPDFTRNLLLDIIHFNQTMH